MAKFIMTVFIKLVWTLIYDPGLNKKKGKFHLVQYIKLGRLVPSV